MWFGVYPGNIDEAVLDKVKSEFIKNHTDISLEELAYCYERMPRPTEKIVVITVHHLIDPIKAYKSVKYHISRECQKMIQEQREQEQRQQKANEFYNESLNRYRECVKTETGWNGSVFASLVLAQCSLFKNRLPEQEKQVIFEQAKKDMNDLKKHIEQHPEHALAFGGYTWQGLAAQMFIKKLVENKVEI